MRSRRLVKLGGVELMLFVSDAWMDRLRSAKRFFRGNGSAVGNRKAATGPEIESPTPQQRAIADKIAAHDWYHTIDLGHGIVTPGFFDHRPFIAEYRLPESLKGKRVLDVATFDGFWAIELEKRGADEVVSVDLAKVSDIDLAPSVRAVMTREELDAELGVGFKIVKDALGSQVKREVISVYDLSPERLGTFDFVFCGDLLIHLQCPVRAVEAISSVTSGIAYFVELYDPSMSMGDYRLANYQGGKTDRVWWSFSEDMLKQMISDSGFAEVQILNHFNIVPRKHPWSPPHVLIKAVAAEAAGG